MQCNYFIPDSHHPRNAHEHQDRYHGHAWRRQDPGAPEGDIDAGGGGGHQGRGDDHRAHHREQAEDGVLHRRLAQQGQEGLCTHIDRLQGHDRQVQGRRLGHGDRWRTGDNQRDRAGGPHSPRRGRQDGARERDVRQGRARCARCRQAAHPDHVQEVAEPVAPGHPPPRRYSSSRGYKREQGYIAFQDRQPFKRRDSIASAHLFTSKKPYIL